MRTFTSILAIGIFTTLSGASSSASPTPSSSFNPGASFTTASRHSDPTSSFDPSASSTTASRHSDPTSSFDPGASFTTASRQGNSTSSASTSPSATPAVGGAETVGAPWVPVVLAAGAVYLGL